MSKQQRTLLITAIVVLTTTVVWIYMSVQRARELQRTIAEAEREAEHPMPALVAPEPDFTLVIRDSKALLKTIAEAADRLEEGHRKRHSFKERGQMFPVELDASFRHLRLDTMKRIQQLDEILEDQAKLTRQQQTALEFLALRKQTAAFRVVVLQTDFGIDPPTK